MFVDLSEPILRYCTRLDIIDALLVSDLLGRGRASNVSRVRALTCAVAWQHEMIHAYLYLTDDPDWKQHGPSFIQLAECDPSPHTTRNTSNNTTHTTHVALRPCVASRTINQEEGANVQPYHKFTREVAFLKLPVGSRPSSPPRPNEPHNGLRELTTDEKESQHQYIGTPPPLHSIEWCSAFFHVTPSSSFFVVSSQALGRGHAGSSGPAARLRRVRQPRTAVPHLPLLGYPQAAALTIFVF